MGSIAFADAPDFPITVVRDSDGDVTTTMVANPEAQVILDASFGGAYAQVIEEGETPTFTQLEATAHGLQAYIQDKIFRDAYHQGAEIGAITARNTAVALMNNAVTLTVTDET